MEFSCLLAIGGIPGQAKLQSTMDTLFPYLLDIFS